MSDVCDVCGRPVAGFRAVSGDLPDKCVVRYDGSFSMSHWQLGYERMKARAEKAEAELANVRDVLNCNSRNEDGLCFECWEDYDEPHSEGCSIGRALGVTR